MVHGAIIYYFNLAVFKKNVFNANGYTAGLWPFSLSIFTAVIFIVNIRLGIFTKFWNVCNVVAIFLTSFVAYFIYMIISDYDSTSKVSQTPILLLSTSHFYF